MKFRILGKLLLKKISKMSKKKKICIVAVFFVIAIILWAFISAGVITGNFNRALVKGGQDKQNVDAIGIIITETKDTKKYFEIYGETGSYTTERNIASLNNVVGNFYKDNEVSMSFQSSKGSYDEINKQITLYENTFIVLKNGTSLQADKFIWSGSDKETIAIGNVKIKKGNSFIADADKCIISAGYDKFKLIGNTKTKLYEDNKEK